MHGATGMSHWTPLANMYANQRHLRFADGPMRFIIWWLAAMRYVTTISGEGRGVKMEFDQIGYEVAGGVATITLNRPNALNALTVQMMTEWYEAMKMAIADDEVRCVVVTGEGRAFVRVLILRRCKIARLMQVMWAMSSISPRLTY